jgi:hypothetical protein
MLKLLLSVSLLSALALTVVLVPAHPVAPAISFCEAPTVLPKNTGLSTYSPALCFQYSGLTAETYTLRAYLLQSGVQFPPCRSSQWCGNDGLPPSVFQINNTSGSNGSGALTVVREMDVFDDTTGAGFRWVIDLHNQAGTIVASAVQNAEATVNRAPTLASIGNRSGTAGQSLTFVVTASDPEGDTLNLIAQNLPPGALFNAATGLFQWPSPAAGTYPNILFKAVQAGAPALSDAELVTIQIGGSAQTLALSANAYTTGEGGPAVVVVTRNGNTGAASVQYTTANLSATAGADYTVAAGTLNFAAGETERAVAVAINNDGQIEPNETYSFTLSNPVGATLGMPASATVTIMDDDTPALAGQWSGVMPWPVVPIHMHLLPNGKVLFWDRHDDALGWDGTPRLWDPATNAFVTLDAPNYDVFCSGHSFMADGKLLVTGGHITDGVGEDKTSLFDPQTNQWTPLPPMNAGRWYPSNVTLANGDVLTLGGTDANGVNTLPQVWQTASSTWRNLTGALQGGPYVWADYYPFVYLAPNGRVFNAGPQRMARYLDTSGTGAWMDIAPSTLVYRDYGSSVLYADGKVLIVGGNLREPNPNAPPTILPSAVTEVIDLAAAQPAWRTVAPLSVGRRHLNTTLLPDGKVLATGGSALPGFNEPAGGVFFAEQWDPGTESWQPLAGYTRYRGYHSNALLLPDGRVLIGGGGHPDPPGVMPQTNVEIYSPPYLFKGNRPTIAAAPTQVAYGQSFFVQTPDGTSIGNVNWVRLGSVTHGFDQNQRINRLSFTAAAGGLNVTAPNNPNLCPPGHYMLFILNGNGVPSVARIVQINTQASNCGTLSINPPVLPHATTGSAYNQMLTAVGGVAPYTFALSAGTLPPGLSLSASGALNGVPSGAGIFNFTLKATDINGCVGAQTYALVVGGSQTFRAVSAGLPAGNFAEFFRDGVSFYRRDGVAGRGFNVAALDPCTQQLVVQNFDTWGSRTTGTAHYQLRDFLQSQPNGTWLLLAVGDEAGLTEFDACTHLDGAWVEDLYQTLGALGSTRIRDYCYRGSWSMLAVKGAGTALAEQLNNTGQAVTQANVGGPLTISPATLPNGFIGTAYTQILTATGAIGTVGFSLSAGTLPGGLNLTPGGTLMGVPTAIGTFTFTVRAAAASGCFVECTYTVIISGNGLQFFPLPSPVRLLDTRPGASPNACSQPNAPIAGQTSRTQLGRNFCTIPANVVALTGNITTVDSGGGFLTLFPSDATQPTVASTNYGVNEIINNVFTVGLGADGAFKIFANNTTDVVVDVTGYYAPPNTANPGGLFFHPLPAPVRLLETRAGQPVGCVLPGTPLIGNAESTQQAISACTGIPAAARAIVGNATTVNPLGGGFLTIFPADATRPLVASSNFNTGQVVNGPFAVGLAANGQFKIYTTSTTDLVIDVLGYYSPEVTDANGTGLLLTPLAHPVRLLETRPGLPVGCFKPGLPLTGGAETTQTARGLCDSITIPANALGVVGNATVVFPVGQGFLTLWPSTAARPLVATSNYNPGDVGNRHFIVGLGLVDGAFKIYTHATTDLVIDLSGYFAP